MIPEKFKERMQNLLMSDYERFISKLENENSVHGLRINTLKMKNYDISDFDGFELRKIEYINDSYILRNHDGIGHTPEHHAGIFYMQDPGAMSSLAALNIKRGFKVLDACAAPGGKSGQIAAAIGEEGFLLSNEYVPKRAKILVKNFERLGVKNAVVTSLDTKEIGKMYEGYFDLVLVDAPCSGEGMFRKSQEAIDDWSEENIKACSERQDEILSNLANLVKDGGYLIYSTCTYSLDENEMVIDAFLKNHPDYEICDVSPSLLPFTANGIQFEGSLSTKLYKTRRFYPHIAEGEGQYLALLKRHAPELREKINYKNGGNNQWQTSIATFSPKATRACASCWAVRARTLPR